MAPKPKIAIFIDWFSPGYKAGGPTRSVMNMVGWLEDAYELFVITGDRDLGDMLPYPGVSTEDWLPYGTGTKVRYLSPQDQSIAVISRLLAEFNPDHIYLNSMFSVPFTWKALLAAKKTVPAAKIVLAPRGMLRPTALRYKAHKKIVFLQVIKLFSLNRRVVFHAADQNEASDVLTVFGKTQPVVWAPNLPKPLAPEFNSHLEKKPGNLKLIYVARVVPIKNLNVVIHALREFKQGVSLTVIGPEEDKPYLQKVRSMIEVLSPTIQVHFLGPKPAHEIEAHLTQAHVFILPTQGENFGHAIFEALQAGRPVVISDQTPWRGLAAQQAGFDLPLSAPDGFAAAIRTFAEMDQDEYDQWSKGAYHFAQNFMQQSDYLTAYQRLFDRP